MTICNRGIITMIPTLILLIGLVVALPGYGHAQDRSIPYRVHDAENLGWLTRIRWGLQWVFIPAALNDIVPFYSYNLREICSSPNYTNQGQGQVADSEDAAENADWGAVLYRDVETAFEDLDVECSPVQDLRLEHAAVIGNWHSITAIREGFDASVGEDHDLFLATTRPLLPYTPSRVFVGENYDIGAFLGNETLPSRQTGD